MRRAAAFTAKGASAVADSISIAHSMVSIGGRREVTRVLKTDLQHFLESEGIAFIDERSDCSFRRHRPVVTPSTPLAVGGLRVRRVCEGGKPNQTAHSVATDAPHRLHTSCTPRRLHTSCAPHRLHAVDSTGRRRPARAPRLLADAGILATSCMHPHKTPQ